MTDERRVSREGIHIDREVADAVSIEAELDANIVAPYRFPDPRRRRTPAVVYTVLAVVSALLFEPWSALLPLGLAGWHLGAAWPLVVDQERALEAAAAQVDFAVGHASAAVSFHGLRGRPRWSVILYSAADPPDRRALVTVDAVTGEPVGDPFVEDGLSS